MTPLSKDNCWRRSMLPKLKAVGLAWCNFQVMRRTHATLMRHLKADPKLVADQLGHTVDIVECVRAKSGCGARCHSIFQSNNDPEMRFRFQYKMILKLGWV